MTEPVTSGLISQLYQSSKPLVAPQPKDAPPPFSAKVEDAANDFMATLRGGEVAAKAGLTGKAEPHSVVMALAASEMAIETAVTLRDKVVEAYQEILRMPV